MNRQSHNEQVLKRLSAKFFVRLCDDVEKIMAYLGPPGASVAREDVERARNIAHRLTGSAGSFGFHEVSVICRRIEIHLDAVLSGRGTIKHIETLDAARRAAAQLVDLGDKQRSG